MASKPSLPALLRAYTSLLSRRTSAQATQILGNELRSQAQALWGRHIEGLVGGIGWTKGQHRLQAIPIPIQAPTRFGRQRWYSTATKAKIYNFEDILAILETPSSPHLLIDVREPSEFDANSIPTAINLPVISQPDALLLSAEDFADRFGFEKPPLDKEIIVFCKAGVRSRAAAGIAREAGYENVGEYPGSWRDWESRGGPGTKSPMETGGESGLK